MTTYLIGEVARLTGLRSKTIRYYEEIALIPPADRSNPSHAPPGYRVYSDPDVKRLRLIKRAKLLDLSLAQLKQLVEAADEGCCEMLEPKLHSLLKSKLQETEAKFRDLGELPKAILIVDGHLREDLTIDIHFGLAKAANKSVVG